MSLLCEIIVQGGKVAADFYKDDPDFAALIRHGFLRQSGVVSSVYCDSCEEPHAAHVVYEDGRYWYICPDLGFIPLEKQNLRAVQPDLPLLISRLADVFGCRGRKSSSLHGLTWRIGAVEVSLETVMLYFHPSLQSEDDARDLQNALFQEPRSEWRLVVTTRGSLPMQRLATVRLDDLVELDPETGQIGRIADPSTLAGVPRKNPGGAPNRFQAPLTELIQERLALGKTLPGRNEEAKALRAAFSERYPGIKAPSLSTIKDYVSKSRTGQ